jgi:purine-binding chemotaxis protein CheW
MIPSAATAPAAALEFVTVRVGRQWFGIAVTAVQEVISEQRVTRVPLAPAHVLGFLNFRGEILTAIDLRVRLAAGEPSGRASMSVVVHDGGELCALVVDEVGDVVSVPAGAVEPLPPTLDTSWGGACGGIVQWPDGLLAVLDARSVLSDPPPRVSTTSLTPRCAA